MDKKVSIGMQNSELQSENRGKIRKSSGKIATPLSAFIN